MSVGSQTLGMQQAVADVGPEDGGGDGPDGGVATESLAFGMTSNRTMPMMAWPMAAIAMAMNGGPQWFAIYTKTCG